MRDQLEFTTNPPPYLPTDNVEQMLTCESHPARPFPMDERCFAGVITQERGTKHEETWELTVTASGWSFGDENIRVALCPECVKKAYDLRGFPAKAETRSSYAIALDAMTQATGESGNMVRAVASYASAFSMNDDTLDTPEGPVRRAFGQLIADLTNAMENL